MISAESAVFFLRFHSYRFCFRLLSVWLLRKVEEKRWRWNFAFYVLDSKI